MIDKLLLEREKAGNPIRVALIGAGATGRVIALQLGTPPPGIRLVAIAARSTKKGMEAFAQAGVKHVKEVSSLNELESNIASGKASVTPDAGMICEAGNVDVVVEMTGSVEFAARVVLQAIENRKHVVLANAELDSTLGPVLSHRARKAGVIYTNIDGDEPGVAMNLVRYLSSLGLRPLVAGNIKGMIDRYRTPDTQREFAEKFNQSPSKVTSFADGTKLSMEAAVLANATGFKVRQRGMSGYECKHVNDIAEMLPAVEEVGEGIVDYVLGAAPHTGAFVVVYETNRRKRDELAYYKMGKGPYYVFYTPFHLPHVQIASSIARAVLQGDATVCPSGKAVCDVVATAKRDLKSGEKLDGVGGFMTYGLIENVEKQREENLLPAGIAEDCELVRPVLKDEPITYDDIRLPANRVCDKMREEQIGLT